MDAPKNQMPIKCIEIIVNDLVGWKTNAEKKKAEAQRMEAEKKALGEECERKRCAEAQHHARAAFSSLRSPLLLCFCLPRESSRP
jgi:hypothetical protein